MPSLIDRYCDISKNLKREKAHNLHISSPIRDPFFWVIFKGLHKLSLEKFFKERNHCFNGLGLYNQVSINLTILETFKVDLSLHL